MRLSYRLFIIIYTELVESLTLQRTFLNQSSQRLFTFNWFAGISYSYTLTVPVLCMVCSSREKDNTTYNYCTVPSNTPSITIRAASDD
jgi:hypothetical protein